MKVNELRQKLMGRKKDELQNLIVEMYKQIPKKMREEKEIDQLIDDSDAFKVKKSANRKSVDNLDFEYVQREIEYFLKNAYDQNYIAPNRIIPKKERSNWRFTAKRLVEQLIALSHQPEYAKTCAARMEDLYELFCYASGHYVFASTEPFYTIKISQEDFFDQVVKLKKRIGEPSKWIRESLLLLVENDGDFQTLKRNVSEVLLENLNNAPLKEEAIKIAKDLLKEKKENIKKAKQAKGNVVGFRNNEYINDLVELIYMIQSSLGEYKNANKYFKQHYISSSSEVKMYIFLELIRRFQRVDDWLEEYELAVLNGVKLREALKNAYEQIKDTKEFPEFIYSC
ncbi:hypothetical protein J2T56_003254 [Natronobacillus azotifigens]|uniref:Uncharacterized protein n=1 Tax=Natronobacillus azotifigens TaxID=472978 RepID=A0A9J6RGU0_9BACI|nr:hypothetical protein [Natronobacillus azotifigens]MCZ0704653.1 hypothetical protein [Natronobacillus azotifigens]